MGVNRRRQATTGLVVLAVVLGWLWVGGLAASAAGTPTDELTMSRPLLVLDPAVPPGRAPALRRPQRHTCLLLGGLGTVLGPVVGAMIFWVVLSLTQGILYGLIESGTITWLNTVQAGQLRYILVGVALMLLMIFRPQGVLGNKKELAFA